MLEQSDGGSETHFIYEGSKAITLLGNIQALPLMYQCTESISISDYFKDIVLAYRYPVALVCSCCFKPEANNFFSTSIQPRP
jgi:hypothetical protein